MSTLHISKVSVSSCALIVLLCSLNARAFSTCSHRVQLPARCQTACFLSGSEEAEALLQKARQVREEIAAMEGKTLEEVEQEASKNKKEQAQAIKQNTISREKSRAQNRNNGNFLNVPETPEDQVAQAKQAVERALADGLYRQVARFALVPEGELLNRDRQWPGGAQEMYREAAGPMTRELLAQVNPKAIGDPNASFSKRNAVESQDIWDFDGSALITATNENTDAVVKAMVLPNTDNKYTKDIEEISDAMQNQPLLLVNPFWRDVESWGINLLAPRAKQNAQRVIFDGGFEETYVLLQKSVRGEDCIALKAYPYDWQMYAYAENDFWPFSEYPIHLGSTKEEPKGSDFARVLEEREEFKLSKNMRQVQRMMGKNE